MNTRTSFFKESDSRLGVFYPQHYIIATFPTFATTQEAAQTLRRAGFNQDDVMAIPASGILEFFEDFRSQSRPWAGVMAMLSRAFGTEQVFADADVACARAGDGFLAIYSPRQGDKSKIQALLKPFEPVAMHWYNPGGIESLV
jgi:hypothetical protein